MSDTTHNLTPEMRELLTSLRQQFVREIGVKRAQLHRIDQLLSIEKQETEHSHLTHGHSDGIIRK